MIRLLFCFLLTCSISIGLSAQTPSVPTTGQETLLDETLNFAKGHQEFRDLYFKQNENNFVRLVKEGQSPQTLFIGCSDSRVVPDLILNSRPGDLFVIRTAGNFVPPYNWQSTDGVAASLQYAVEVLNVRHIVVCGHSHCGAIKGLFQELDPNKLDILQRWLKLGEKAKRMTLLTAKSTTPKEDLYATAEEVSVIFQLENLLTYPFVKKKINEGNLELHGWYFKIESGELWYYNLEQYRFVPLSEKTTEKAILSPSKT
jgi:carbonic anhydrase